VAWVGTNDPHERQRRELLTDIITDCVMISMILFFIAKSIQVERVSQQILSIGCNIHCYNTTNIILQT
jgi:hypothetical protein